MPKKVLLPLVFGLCLAAARTEGAPLLREVNFPEQNIKDILVSFSVLLSRTIVPDQTVQGKASFYAQDISAADALNLFLELNRLYTRENNSVLVVSRIRLELRPGGNLDVRASNIELNALLDAISEQAGLSIVRQQVPVGSVSVIAQDLPPRRVLEIALAKFPEFSVVQKDTHIIIQRLPTAGGTTGTQAGGGLVHHPETGRFSLSLQKERLFPILEKLFGARQLPFVQTLSNDILLERMEVREATFEEILELLLAQAGAGYAEIGGVYHIFSLANSSASDRFQTTVIYQIPAPAGKRDSIHAAAAHGRDGGNTL